MGFVNTQCQMSITPREWEDFKARVMDMVWDDAPGILEVKDDYTLICTEPDAQNPWAYYDEKRGILHLSHPYNYVYAYGE